MESMLIPEESNYSTRTNNIYWARRIGRESFKEKDILFNFYIESSTGPSGVSGKVWITKPPYYIVHIIYMIHTLSLICLLIVYV